MFEIYKSFAKTEDKIKSSDSRMLSFKSSINRVKCKYDISIIFYSIAIIFGRYQLNIFHFCQTTLRCKSSVDSYVGFPPTKKVDDHCARIPRTVKSDHKDERAHDTQQWTMPIDASGPRCKLSVLWLRSCICDSLNQDVTTISSYAGFFFREFISSPVRLSPRGILHTVLLSYCRFECDSYSLYHDGSAPLISDTHLVFGCVNLNAR